MSSKKVEEYNSWYFYRFRLNDKSNKGTRWWIDIFIIDTIIRQVIQNRSEFKIDLWRFHRRSAKDKAGHQVSLCCYTTNLNSVKISDFIKRTEEFKILLKSNLLKKYFMEKGGTEIEGSGDGSWSKEIQKTWPLFIQGASESILALILFISYNFRYSHDLNTILDIEEYYKNINEKLNLLWYNEGGHAFLHHLNALFGYEMIKTRQTVITSF